MRWWSYLFTGPWTIQAIMWQGNLTGVARFVDMCHNMVGSPTISNGPVMISLVRLIEI